MSSSDGSNILNPKDTFLGAPLTAPLTGGVRFAPSPTGRFHVGNLRTAWISYQIAQTLHKPWIVRVEDIDLARVLPGARELQLEDLATLGMIPDATLIQSMFRPRHWQVFIEGINTKQIYPCFCSRKEVQEAIGNISSAPNDSSRPIYSGTCRRREESDIGIDRDSIKIKTDLIAWRFRMKDNSGKDDFVVARSAWQANISDIPDEKSFSPAYNWACAIDDFDGGYDLIVRSSDLKNVLSLQQEIQTWLANQAQRRAIPSVFHTALVTQNDGKRLEKRTLGITLPELEVRGISATDLIERFRKSFDLAFAFALVSQELLALSQGAQVRSQIWGEQRDCITLSDLDI